MARDSSDMAIFHVPRRQNIDVGRPNTVIGKRRVIPARTDIFFIMWPIVLWPNGTVEYQMTSDDGLDLAPLKCF